MFDWTGRFDGEEESYHRIFQRVKTETDYETINPNDFVLHGFAVDEGVKRNKGRVGAEEAPNIIRKNISNFPVVNSKFSLRDFGNIKCENNDLESTQNLLAEKVSKALLKQGKSVVLGGGHEVTFAHYSGIKKAFPNQKIGIINFDAHFDNREPENGLASSGTGFWQIAQEGDLHYDQMHKRMAKEFARIEDKYVKEESIVNWQNLSVNGKDRNRLTYESIYELFKDFKYIVPQGSIMSQLGSKSIGSLSNCFVIGTPEDSYGGIFQKDEQMAQLLKRRGGV